MQDPQTSSERHIRDTKGRRLTLKSLLGRGSFARVYRTVDDQGSEGVVARFPLTEDDGGGEAISTEMAELYARLLRDQAAYWKKLPPLPFLKSFGLVDGGGAVPCLLLEAADDSLLERLRRGMTFAELCRDLVSVCHALQPLHESGLTHGNLKPGNIFFVSDERGDKVVRFSDPASPTYLSSLTALSDRQPALPHWWPPEVLGPAVAHPLPPVADTFALAKLLYSAVVEKELLTVSYSGRSGPFAGGVDKPALARFKQALAERLAEGDSNQNVREVLIRKATSFVSRALSQETQPSPPYRFQSVAEMGSRLEELAELFHPGFAQVGQLISDSSRADGSFRAEDEIRVTLSFRCQGGLDDVDLVTCLTNLRNVELGEKVKDAGIEVRPSHDGHRFRFTFRIPRLRVGKYLLRVALAIKGSPGKPHQREFAFDVLAPEFSQSAPDGESLRQERPDPEVARAPISLVSSRGGSTLPSKPGSTRPAELERGSDNRSGGGRKGEEPPVRGTGPSQRGAKLTPALEEADSLEPREPFSGDWLAPKEVTKAGKDLVWSVDEKEKPPRSSESVPSGESRSPSPASRPEIRVRPEEPAPRATPERSIERSSERGGLLDLEEGLSKATGKSRTPVVLPKVSLDLDDSPLPPLERRSSLPSSPGIETSRKKEGTPIPSVGLGPEDTQEMAPEEAARIQRRARLGPVTVGEDALRSVPVAPTEPGPRLESLSRGKGSDKGNRERAERSDRGERAEKSERTERKETKESRAEREASSGRKSEPKGDSWRRFAQDRMPGDGGAAPGESDKRERPGREFVPELYYREARNRPLPGEEDEAFFRRGAWKPQQYVILFVILGIVGVGIVALLLSLLFF